MGRCTPLLSSSLSWSDEMFMSLPALHVFLHSFKDSNANRARKISHSGSRQSCLVKWAGHCSLLHKEVPHRQNASWPWCQLAWRQDGRENSREGLNPGTVSSALVTSRCPWHLLNIWSCLQCCETIGPPRLVISMWTGRVSTYSRSTTFPLGNTRDWIWNLLLHAKHRNLLWIAIRLSVTHLGQYCQLRWAKTVQGRNTLQSCTSSRDAGAWDLLHAKRGL